MNGSDTVCQEGDAVVQFSVMLQNRVGSLSSLIALIRNIGEEVIGLSMQDGKDATIVRMIVTDPEVVQPLFLEKGIPHTTCRMVIVSLVDSCVDIERCLKILRDGETNVDFMYSLIPSPARKNLVAFHLEDYEFGSGLLRQAGFKVYFQEDLSR